MAVTTVAQLAAELNRPAASLLEQLGAAGVAKGSVDLGSLQDEAEKKQAEEAAATFKPVLDRLKEALKDRAKDVRVTTRLVDSPACLVVDAGDMSGHLARLLKQAGIKAGDQVLIYGASGSVGTFAVQIARAFGAEITAVCSTSNVDMVAQLGAKQVIDYKKEDFTASEQRFNIILDAVGKTSKSASRHLLKPGGKYVSVTGSPKSAPDDLEVLKGLLEAGKLVPVIDRKYPLEQIREAHTYAESFRKKGNVVINVI